LVHAFTIHVTVLILLKGVLYARSSRLIPDKANLGFRFPCDGPGRGGTCQVSAWDHVFLGLFWMVRHVPIATRLIRNETNVGRPMLYTFNNNLGNVGEVSA
jgi:hypothetical protein